MEKHIRVIINPFSGKGKHTDIESSIGVLLNHPSFISDVHYTLGPMHATDLAQEAVDLNYYAVVCCGGDGTVNEVLSPLLNTKTALAVIPIGSGNGFARHLGYSTLPAKAAQQVTKAQSMLIDTCLANDKPFLNVAGIGLDALVAHDFAVQPERGFWAYTSSVLRLWFKTNNKVYKLKLDGKKITTKALMISFANGSQFGNNALIAPNASLTDGLMEVCFLRKFPTFRAPVIVWKLFSGRMPKSRYLRVLQAKSVEIKRPRKKIHLDGEPFKLSKKLHLEVMPASLNILAPLDYYNTHGPQHSLN
jgi:YegS/Rv2252/BmrU family lipid kinase